MNLHPLRSLSVVIIQILFLNIILLFVTKFFQSTPFETLFFQIQAGFLGMIILFLILYVLDLIVKGQSIDKVVLYFLVLILFMPIYSAYRSNIEFGQPYLYGLLSQRSWVLLGIGIWFYYMLISNKVSLNTIEKSFVSMAWISLVVFSLFVLTFDPSQLTGDENFAHITKERGLRFKFQTFFISFGALYYFIRYTIHKKKFDLIILFLFLMYIVFIIQGRTYMLFLAITFFLFYYFNYSMSKFVVILIKVMLLITGLLIVLQMFMPEFIDKMSDLFMQMITVLGGDKSTDSSANARIFQSNIVLNYFDSHPLSVIFGTGRVSHQWNDGYESIFGYFFPEDIGLLGGIFLYGLTGIVLLLLVPLLFVIKEIKFAKHTNDIFIMTIKYLLILSILKSLQGGLYFGPSIWIVLFFILYGSNTINKRLL